MKRFMLFFLFALAPALLVGCGTVGSDFDESRVGDIKNHVTTQSQILDWFGPPYKEGVENGRRMWTYQKDTYAVLGGADSKDLVILFDDNNNVIAYRYTTNAPNIHSE